MIKYLLPILAAFALVGTSVYAGCGKKAASIGKLEAYDAETKSVTIKVMRSSDPKEAAAKTAKLTLTPDTGVVGGEIEKLVGKQVSVVSEHGKVDYVIALAAGPARAGAKAKGAAKKKKPADAAE